MFPSLHVGAYFRSSCKIGWINLKPLRKETTELGRSLSLASISTLRFLTNSSGNQFSYPSLFVFHFSISVSHDLWKIFCCFEVVDLRIHFSGRLRIVFVTLEWLFVFVDLRFTFTWFVKIFHTSQCLDMFCWMPNRCHVCRIGNHNGLVWILIAWFKCR